MRIYLVTLAALALAACGTESPRNQNGATPNVNTQNTSQVNTNKSGPVTEYTYEIVKTYPHDRKAFTEGLQYVGGFLYEGTGGKPGEDGFVSTLRKVDLASGQVVKKYDIPPEYFGEGITVLNNNIYQLTWQERTGFVYGLEDFKLVREVRYSGEGWGMTTDGTNLIMTDGTHVIRYVDPETFKTTKTITVMDEKGQPILKLNELELIKGELWANIWQSGWILRIDPATGKLLGRVDLRPLADQIRTEEPKSDVLNGIAYDPSSDRIFVTGKLWSKLYEIKVSPK